MAKILVADDEEDFAWSVAQILRLEGHEVMTAKDGFEALSIVRRAWPDLIILDIVMPRMDGLQLCETIRRDLGLTDIPVLLLTVKGQLGDRVKGLDIGADDYLVKPFDLEELPARVRALLRRSLVTSEIRVGREAQVSVMNVGLLSLDLRSRQVRVGGKTVQLTPSEFELLHHLMAHPGELLSSMELLQQVWGYPLRTAEPSLVRRHIKNLRAKIEADPANPRCIRTVARQGYVLVVDESGSD